MVSIAYMDPGNYGTDIAAGAAFKYDLLWAAWFAGGMAMLLQYLSGKLGIASGYSLPELVRMSLVKRRYVVPYWLAAEAAVAATDLAEYLGTVLGLNLLFGVPLLYEENPFQGSCNCTYDSICSQTGNTCSCHSAVSESNCYAHRLCPRDRPDIRIGNRNHLHSDSARIGALLLGAWNNSRPSHHGGIDREALERMGQTNSYKSYQRVSNHFRNTPRTRPAQSARLQSSNSKSHDPSPDDSSRLLYLKEEVHGRFRQ